MKRLLVFILLGLAWAPPALAALFYEFNPDYSQSLLVASSETVSEVFLPLNDYLGALDFWVSNADTAGAATFTLYNPSGTAVAERTVSVPAIADTSGGTRLRVNLPSQIAVKGNAAYRVRIATVVPSFRLYYADQTQLLAHNGSPLPAYTGGLARIGADDMGFSFKFALYENQESAPPQLTGVAVSQVSPYQSVITFNANEPVDRNLLYTGTIIDYIGEYSSCAPTIQVCTVTLAVSPDTTYNFTLTVRDVWGNQSTATGTFTSLSDGQAPTSTPTPTTSTPPTPTPSPTATPDTAKPVMTNVRLVAATAHNASFAWTTNEAANGLIVVQLLPYFITANANSDSTLELEHFITVSDLPSDTYLRATITTSDSVGNVATASLNFMTLVETSTPTASPGVTTTPVSTPVVTGPAGDPSISWSAPAGGEPSDGYRIDIFDAANNLIKTIMVPAGQLSATLGALPEGDNRVVIYANNDGVFEKVADPVPYVVRPQGFLEHLLSYLPYILGGIFAVIIVVVVVLKLRKPNPPAGGPVLPPPSPVSGAQPNPGQV